MANSRKLRGSVEFREASVKQFNADLRRSARDLERSMAAIAARLKLADGFFVTDARNLARLAVARREIAQRLKDSGYQDAVGRLLGTRSKIARAVQQEYRAFSGKRAAFAKPDLDAFAAISGAHFDAFADLGDEAVNVMRRGLQRAVSTGESFESWSKQLALTLDNGATVAAARTLARTATTQLHRVMQRRLDDELGITRWTYVGPDDDVTRPFCSALIAEAEAGETWTEEEIDELDNSRENGGAGAGPGSAREQGGGWNCRHLWEPVLEPERP